MSGLVCHLTYYIHHNTVESVAAFKDFGGAGRGEFFYNAEVGSTVGTVCREGNT